MTNVNYYEVLGAPSTASEAEIRAAHKRKVMLVHPDRGGRDEEFRLVQEAYETLRDPVRRAAYDAVVTFAVERSRTDEPPTTADPAPAAATWAGSMPGSMPGGAWSAARAAPSWPVHPPVSRSRSPFLLIAGLTLFVLLADMGLVIAEWVYGGDPAVVHGVLLAPTVVYVVLWMFGHRVPLPVRVGTILFMLHLVSSGVLAVVRGDVLTGTLVAMLVSGIVAVPKIGRRYHAAR